jgi:glutathione synthase
MAQRYLPEISAGDKRILLIAGQPVPYCLARIPKAGETRATSPPAAPAWRRIFPHATAKSPKRSAPILWARGLLIVGLDVIGDHLTEINVTSPTCMVEIASRRASTRPGLSSPPSSTHAAA